MKNNHRFLLNCCSITLLIYGISPGFITNAQPTSTQPPIPSVVEQSPDSTSITPTASSASASPSNQPTTVSSANPQSSSLWPLGILLLLPLHIVEIWGIIQLFLSLKKSQRDQEQNSKTLKDENKKLSEELKEFSKKLQKYETNLKKTEKDSVKIDGANFNIKPTLLFPESVANLLESPASYYNHSESTPPSDYQFLDVYNHNPENFFQQYALTVVSEDATNINDRRSGESTDIILSESRNGNYWLVKEDNTTYLIPRPKVKIQEHNIRTVKGLFDCSTFEPDYHNFTVVQPAIVSVQPMADGLKWKVEQKGELQFT